MYDPGASFQNINPVWMATEPGIHEFTTLRSVKLEVKDFQIAEVGA
jgi:hypothetical protein